jgi:hypothetical protein
MRKLMLSALALFVMSSGVFAQDDAKKKNAIEKKTEKKEMVKPDGTPVGESQSAPPAPSSKMAINEKPVDTRPKKTKTATSNAKKSDETKHDEVIKDKMD